MNNKNHILPFLWMHGASDEKKLELLHAIYDSGARAVCLEARPHPDFAGELWWHDVEVILKEAKKLDMKVWILDDAHFPTGLANGAVVDAPEKLKRICLEEKHIDICGPVSDMMVDIESKLNIDIKTGEIKKDYFKEKVVELLFCKVHKEKDNEPVELIKCMTDDIADGKISISAPEGSYRLYIITSKIHASMFLSDAVSFLNPKSVKLLIDAVYEPHYKHFAEWFSDTIEGFFSDEPGFFNLRDTGYGDVPRTGETSEPLPWTAELYEKMKAEASFDVRSALPYLFGAFSVEPGLDKRIRTYYMDLVSRAYETNFTKQLADWCSAHKVKYIGHVVEDNPSYERLGQGTGHYFRAIRQQHMAGIDVVLNCLLPDFDDGAGMFYTYGLPQLAASCAHHSSKQKGRALCELFGAYGWSEGVTLMKWMADFMLVHGINEFVPHAFTDSPFPDEDCPPHFYAQGNNPQFHAVGKLFGYMNHMAELLSDTVPVVNNAVFFEAESDWAGETMPYYEVGKELITHQMEYQLVCVDDLETASYENGVMHIGDSSYTNLFIPQLCYMSESVAQLLNTVQKQGIKVYMVGNRPAAYDGKAIASLKDIPVIPLSDVAANAKKAAVTLTGDDTKWVHTTTYCDGNSVIHVLFNSSMKKTVEAEAVFEKYMQENSALVRMDIMDSRCVCECMFRQQVILEPGETAVYIEVKKEDVPKNIFMKSPLSFEHIAVDSWKLTLLPYDGNGNEIEAGELCTLYDLYEKYPEFAGKVRYETMIELEGKSCIRLEKATEAVSVWIDDTFIGCNIGNPYIYELPEKMNKTVKLVIEAASTLFGPMQDTLSKQRELPKLGFTGEVWAG